MLTTRHVRVTLSTSVSQIKENFLFLRNTYKFLNLYKYLTEKKNNLSQLANWLTVIKQKK